METQELQFDLSKTKGAICNKCGSSYFSQVFLLRRISKFQIGTKEDKLYPIPVFQCTNCGHVNNEFLPAELRKEFSGIK